MIQYWAESGKGALQKRHDEDLFEWLVSSELVIVDTTISGAAAVTARSQPRMYVGLDSSPDDSKLLLSWIERPFSYELPVGRFPRVWQVWDRCVRQCSYLISCLATFASRMVPVAKRPFVARMPSQE